ncbi:hypothetical protein EDD29_0368 [Actinocorallia herbida]|uniref:Uncharacterized protein n=1 Tax=Actinocorallia herbida TaxID=58109 RepID=A0A3N1CNN1_9ACTN|nr:hypothetical protein [Actinocorallia herbida]ROO82883.1 hypothetical protein EDD29_0368 [Actinocorallia herbida]
MNNSARHVLGGIIGLMVWLPLVVAGGWASRKVTTTARYFEVQAGEVVPGILVLLLCALVVGLLCGSRISPLASLVAGGLMSVLSLLWLLSPAQGSELLDAVLPDSFMIPVLDFIGVGMGLLLGLSMVVASLPPSRWAARSPRVLPSGGPSPLPFGGAPVPAPGQPPFGQPPFGGAPAPVPAPGQPPFGGAPGPVPPPHLPHVPAAPPAGPAPEPGQWAAPSPGDGAGKEER